MKIVRATDPGFARLWDALWIADGLCYPLYGMMNLAYYRAYFGREFHDLSFVVEVGGEPVAGLAVTSHVRDDGQMVLSCCGLPTLFLARGGLPSRTRRDAAQAVREETAAMLEGAAHVEHRDYLINGALSDFSRLLLSLGANATPFYTQVIDVTRSEEQLHRDLSKSFRWNVNWGAKHLALRITCAGPSATDDLNVLRALHMEAAGRETRPETSWARQLDMVQGGEAFVVVAEMEKQPVSAALFSMSTTWCFYAVSASRRALFDKPISHALVWAAIRHAKDKGCRWFETGEQQFPVPGAHAPSEKELGISAFKRGFGGNTRVRLTVSLSQSRPVPDES